MHRLPERYQGRHEYSITLYNQILTLFKGIEKRNALKTKLEAKSPTDFEDLRTLNDGELRGWLLAHGYDDAVYLLDYRHCVATIVTDALQFLLTALNSSERGQVDVAYLLLKKPLRDDLFYLEYLLAFPEEFIALFNDTGSAERLAFGDRAMSKYKIVSVIEGALKQIGIPFFTAPALYDLRFNTEHPACFDRYFDESSRLSVSHRLSSDGNGNIGFDYTDEEAAIARWDHFYQNVPGLLLYMFSLVSKLVDTIAKLPSYWPLLQARYLLSLVYATNGNDFLPIKDHFREIFVGIRETCDACGETVPYDEKQFIHFTSTFTIRCQNCSKEYRLADTRNGT